MDKTIVRDHVRDREDPGVTSLGQQVGSCSGQSPPRGHQPIVDFVDPPCDRADFLQLEHRHRSTGQHSPPGTGLDQGQHRRRGHRNVGVQVQPGERGTRRIAEPQGVWLARHVGLDHPHPDRSGGFCRLVGTRIGNDHEVKHSGFRPGQQQAQIAGKDGLLVVRRHDDADDGPLRGLGRLIRLIRLIACHPIIVPRPDSVPGSSRR